MQFLNISALVVNLTIAAYLRHLFTELPKTNTVFEDIEALLPRNLGKDQISNLLSNLVVRQPVTYGFGNCA